jgi:hypothetical protein
MMQAMHTRPLFVLTLLGFFAASLVSIDDSEAQRRRNRRAPTGTLQIFCFTEGATIEINGEQRGTTPMNAPLTLEPGNYTVRVFKRGYTEFVEAVDVARGQNTELDANLIAFAGLVRIDVNVDEATIAVDGVVSGQASRSNPFDKDIPAGQHEFTVQAPGYQPFTQTVEVEAGNPLTLTVSLAIVPDQPAVAASTPVYESWWFWTIIGTVVVGGATAGVVLGTQSGGETIAPAQAEITLLP